MPHIVDIKCPQCGGHANFEFSEIVKINLKRDIPFFQESTLFENCQFIDSCGHKWHAAIFYPILQGCSTEAIGDLPEGCKPEDWEHSKYFSGDRRCIYIGAFRCHSCHLCESNVLNWPNDALHQIEKKGSTLWAFNRKSLVDLRDFILSKEREVGSHKWSFYLRHVPSVFKSKNNLGKVVKKLNKIGN